MTDERGWEGLDLLLQVGRPLDYLHGESKNLRRKHQEDTKETEGCRTLPLQVAWRTKVRNAWATASRSHSEGTNNCRDNARCSGGKGMAKGRGRGNGGWRGDAPCGGWLQYTGQLLG